MPPSGKLYLCIDHRTHEKITSIEIVDSPVLSTCMSVACIKNKNDFVDMYYKFITINTKTHSNKNCNNFNSCISNSIANYHGYERYM